MTVFIIFSSVYSRSSIITIVMLSLHALRQHLTCHGFRQRLICLFTKEQRLKFGFKMLKLYLQGGVEIRITKN